MTSPGTRRRAAPAAGQVSWWSAGRMRAGRGWNFPRARAEVRRPQRQATEGREGDGGRVWRMRMRRDAMRRGKGRRDWGEEEGRTIEKRGAGQMGGEAAALSRTPTDRRMTALPFVRVRIQYACSFSPSTSSARRLLLLAAVAATEHSAAVNGQPSEWMMHVSSA